MDDKDRIDTSTCSHSLVPGRWLDSHADTVMSDKLNKIQDFQKKKKSF